MYSTDICEGRGKQRSISVDWRPLPFSVFSHMRETLSTQAGFLLLIYLKISLKLLIIFINCPEYTITRERIFLFPCLKILHGHSNWWTQCNHREPVCGPAERSEKLLLFLLYPCLLCEREEGWRLQLPIHHAILYYQTLRHPLLHTTQPNFNLFSECAPTTGWKCTYSLLLCII